MMVNGAVTALAMVIVSVGAIRGPLRSNKRRTTFSNYLSSTEKNPRTWRRTRRSMIVSGSGDTFSRNGAVHRCDILLSGRTLPIQHATVLGEKRLAELLGEIRRWHHIGTLPGLMISAALPCRGKIPCST
jgi:hypothetical protein